MPGTWAGAPRITRAAADTSRPTNPPVIPRKIATVRNWTMIPFYTQARGHGARVAPPTRLALVIRLTTVTEPRGRCPVPRARERSELPPRIQRVSNANRDQVHAQH